MALTKAKKHEIVDEVAQLIEQSKMTVVAEYQGTSVKQMQDLRKAAKAEGSQVKVIKNRLVIKALAGNDTYKDADTSALTSQLLYAFNNADEVAPAKALHEFAKKNPSIKFVGAFTSEGSFISAEEVKSLAALPSKQAMIAGILNTLNAPLNDTMNGLKGDLHGYLKAIEAKAA